MHTLQCQLASARMQPEYGDFTSAQVLTATAFSGPAAVQHDVRKRMPCGKQRSGASAPKAMT
eukprot:2312860-Lingulodinium_polyedra.AAC.1